LWIFSSRKLHEPRCHASSLASVVRTFAPRSTHAIAARS
jgi:hypothetical protein